MLLYVPKQKDKKENTDDEKKKLYIINSRITRISDCSRMWIQCRKCGYHKTADAGNTDQVEEGDQVQVTYTGEVSEVDPFTGTVISVEKQ